MLVKHVQHKDIDYDRWDKCISQASNQLTYAYSWYLDIVSPNWEALIYNDYEYIMPLPLKRRYGVPYLVQPILTQQLGIFSKQVIKQDIIKQFIKKLPTSSYELNLNEYNFHPSAIVSTNYILELKESYQQIASRYSKNTQRNIDKAIKLNLTVQNGLSLNDFLSFYYSVEKSYKSAEQSIVEKLIDRGINENGMSLYGVFSAEDEIIAGLCLMHSKNRITYLLPISNIQGKTSSAMFFLIDNLIREEAGNNIIFDFEGSRIEGIARFYRGFGAKNQPYYILKRFRPEFLIRKLKKNQ